MRHVLGAFFIVLFSSVSLQAKPTPKEKQPEPKAKEATFQPVNIDGELTQNDANDPKLNAPAKTFGQKFQKGKTYIIDMASQDFDAYLRVLDENGTQLAEDDDSGGDLNSRIIFSPMTDGEYKIVATTFDGDVGKFKLKVREFQLKGEAKARDVGKNGLAINDRIAQADASDIGKLGKTYSIEMKAGQTYTIDLQSNDIDSYLYLFDAKGMKLAEDDDSGDDVNSRIVFRPERDGIYHIIATSLAGDETGAIALRVRKE